MRKQQSGTMLLPTLLLVFVECLRSRYHRRDQRAHPHTLKNSTNRTTHLGEGSRLQFFARQVTHSRRARGRWWVPVLFDKPNEEDRDEGAGSIRSVSESASTWRAKYWRQCDAIHSEAIRRKLTDTAKAGAQAKGCATVALSVARRRLR